MIFLYGQYKSVLTSVRNGLANASGISILLPIVSLRKRFRSYLFKMIFYKKLAYFRFLIDKANIK